LAASERVHLKQRNRKMDILVITWNFPPRRGGSEYLLSHLVAGLRKHHAVSVITAYAPLQQGKENDVFRAPVPGLIPFACYALWRGAWLLVRNRQIEVIFGGSVMVTPLVLILARVFGRKAVVQAHGLDVVYPALLYRLLCSGWIRFCDRVIANSVFTASAVEKRGLRTRPISVIPLGIDASRFARSESVEIAKKAFDLERKRVILFVGRLVKRKGVAEFVRNALPKIVQSIPNACFVVVGENPRESLAHQADVLSEIKTAVRECGLTESVRLLGALSDDAVARIYQACDIVVMPALALAADVEGFGLVILEAGASGKPVVATRTGGIPDAVREGETAILLEPEDYEAMSRSVVALLCDEKTRAAMGENGRQHVLQHFNWQRVLADYEVALNLRAKVS
jgi:phosphatidylinositol alpha-1,6-mannosyltransferase